jgi:hypothetical protein
LIYGFCSIYLAANKDCFTFEIHHGGFFYHLDMDKERKKYKNGYTHYLDEIDPEKCSWVELNNIAWDLGYRSRPISYWYKLPRVPASDGYKPIISDEDVVEMTHHIPPRKRILQLYITGGGPRLVKEAKKDDVVPRPPDWSNPLNTWLPGERERK